MAYPPLKRTFAAAVFALSFLASCSHSSAKKDTISLSELEGKKVALIEITGEPTAQNVVSIALVNQLSKRGSFFLIPRQDVDAARTAPDQDPRDWKGIGKRAGGDFALRIQVERFQADTHQGYSAVKEKDSELEAEQGSGHGETERLYKVKAVEGEVDLKFELANLSNGELKSGEGQASGHQEAGSPNEAPHLQPKMHFLEGLTEQAMQKFFDRYL